MGTDDAQSPKGTAEKRKKHGSAIDSDCSAFQPAAKSQKVHSMEKLAAPDDAFVASHTACSSRGSLHAGTGNQPDAEDLRRNMQSSVAARLAKILAGQPQEEEAVEAATTVTSATASSSSSSPPPRSSSSTLANVQQASAVVQVCEGSAPLAGMLAAGLPWSLAFHASPNVAVAPVAVPLSRPAEAAPGVPTSRTPIEDRLQQKSDRFAAAWKNAETYASQLKSGKYLKPDGGVGIARGPRAGLPRNQLPMTPTIGFDPMSAMAAAAGMAGWGHCLPSIACPTVLPPSVGTSGVAAMGMPFMGQGRRMPPALEAQWALLNSAGGVAWAPGTAPPPQ